MTRDPSMGRQVWVVPQLFGDGGAPLCRAPWGQCVGQGSPSTPGRVPTLGSCQPRRLLPAEPPGGPWPGSLGAGCSGAVSAPTGR